MSFTQSLRDPVLFAIPAFLLFMALEILSLRFLDDRRGASDYAGYERRDTRTNVSWASGRWS